MAYLPTSTSTASKPRAVSAFGSFAPDSFATNNTDSFGSSGVDATAAPTTAAPVTAPTTTTPPPDDFDPREANIAGGHLAGDGSSFDEAVLGGGYQDGKGYVKPPPKTFDEHLADTGRILGGAAGTLANPTGILGSDYNDVSGILNPVGQGIQGAIDEGLDRGLEGGSGSMGPDIVPFVASGGDGVGGASQIGGGASSFGLDDIPGLGFGGLNGGGGAGGAPGGALAGGLAGAEASKAMGRDVLAGNIAPAGAGAEIQGNVFGQASNFTNGARATDVAAGAVNNYQAGPRAQDSTIAGLDNFLAAPEGPSKAQLLLDQGAQGAMADVLSASRSGRSRNAGDQARMSAVAQGELAGMGVDNARNMGLLRAQEADDFRKQQLGGLQAKGGLAQGIDQGTLEALGLGSTLAQGRDQNTLGGLGLQGDVASQIRNANVAERGDTLNAGVNLEQIGAQQQGDVLKTIPQLEQIRHDDLLRTHGRLRRR